MSELHFFLFHQKDEISVYDLNNEALTPLRFKGEEQQRYAADEQSQRAFWSGFKQKIGYQNQPLNFLVVTDDDTFELPEELLLSDSYQADHPALSKLAARLELSQHTPLTYPTCDDFALPIDNNSTVAVEEIIAEEPSSTKTPRDFFIKKTRSYRNS